MKKTPAKPDATRGPRSSDDHGGIHLDAIYTFAEFSKRTGLKYAALRAMRKAGLPVRRVGGRVFIMGADFAEFLKKADGQAPGRRPKE